MWHTHTHMPGGMGERERGRKREKERDKAAVQKVRKTEALIESRAHVPGGELSPQLLLGISKARLGLHRHYGACYTPVFLL